mmetsp:Transcript_20499/g.49387  ORF Transcript_20499/g.49387 Transcript_20499/m.49387 type:complete len:350 (+) Transcript_20499:64-1113(+)
MPQSEAKSGPPPAAPPPAHLARASRGADSTPQAHSAPQAHAAPIGARPTGPTPAVSRSPAPYLVGSESAARFRPLAGKSEGVLALAALGEDGETIRPLEAKALLDLFAVPPQKRVCGLLELHSRGYRRLTLAACISNLLHALLQRLVARLDRQGELAVCLCVLVGAIDGCVVWQRCKALQRRVHLIIGSLEHAPAPHRKERVPDKRYPELLKVVCDVSLGVAADVDNVADEIPHLDRVTLVYGCVDAWNLARFAPWADNVALCRTLETQVPASVVVLVVRVENVGQLPPLLLELFEVGVNLGRVDGRGGASLLAVEEVSIVVGQAGELCDLHCCRARRGSARVGTDCGC